MTTINTQQVLTQAMVGALTVGIMSSAMGIMMSTMGASAYTVKPSELKGTEAAVRELKLAFGGNVVDRAVKNVGVDSMLALAQETERLITADMVKQYGVLATDAALAAAPHGDIAAAYEIAKMLASSGIKAGSWAAWLDNAPLAQVEQVVTAAEKKSSVHPPKPVTDTKTGITYRSHYAAGVAVALEYGLDPKDTHTWFEVVKRDPNRFIAAGAGSYIAPKASTPIQTTRLLQLTGITPHEMTESERITEEYEKSESLSLSEGLKKYEAEAKTTVLTPATKRALVKSVLPEADHILKDMSMLDIPGNKLQKPLKFMERLGVIAAPAKFNPSSQGDYAYTHSYSYDGKHLTPGPSYSYDTMMNSVGSPYERTVEVPRGTRVWICTYDGQWGGYWSRVDVFVNAEDIAASPGLKRLSESK